MTPEGEARHRPVLTVTQIREADRRAIEDVGIPGVVLMENAGRGAADVALDMLGTSVQPHVLVLAGRGNNGGDGFVVARHLYNHGVGVSVCVLAKFDDIKGDARTNFEIVQRMGLDVREIELPGGKDALSEELQAADLVVDALLGTGAKGEIRDPFRTAVELINASKRPVLAVDIPSGLEGDTGAVLGPCVVAGHTVTFAAAKTGMLRERAKRFVGKIHVVDIGMPRSILDELAGDS